MQFWAKTLFVRTKRLTCLMTTGAMHTNGYHGSTGRVVFSYPVGDEDD